MQNNIFSIANVVLTSLLIVELLILVFSIVAIFRKEKDAFSLWGRWTFITFLGFQAAEFLYMLTRNTFDTIGISLAAGSVLGIAQWFVLRTRLAKSEYWILATSIGFLASVSITSFSGNNIELLFGLFLGAIQLLILGPQYRGSIWWIIASTIGLGFWMWITSTAGWPNLLLSTTIGVSPIVYNALTGIVIAWLIQKSSSSEKGNAS